MSIARGDSGESGDFGYNATRDVYRWTSAHGGVGRPVLLPGRRRASGRPRQPERRQRATTSEPARPSWWASGGPIERLTTSASLRYDDPDVYRGQATARAGSGYALGDGFSLSASWGQGFKTPTISETACDFCFTTPVTNLQPEHADGEDIGLVWRSSDNRFSARTTVFALNVRDEIEYVS